MIQAFQLAQQVTPQPNLVQKFPNFEKLRPLFAFQPTNIIQKTFENTTQLARLSEGTVLKKHYKSPNPALNVERRKEAIATDTIFANVKALNLGVNEAQIFVGVDTLVTNVFPLKSQKHFPKILMDVILLHGSPTKLISDSAKSETSEKVKDIRRTLIIPQWQSEPHHQHQNYAERRIQDLKQIANTVLDCSGVPDDLWFKYFQYVCDVLNHSTNQVFLCSSLTVSHKISVLSYCSASIKGFYIESKKFCSLQNLGRTLDILLASHIMSARP